MIISKNATITFKIANANKAESDVLHLDKAAAKANISKWMDNSIYTEGYDSKGNLNCWFKVYDRNDLDRLDGLLNYNHIQRFGGTAIYTDIPAVYAYDFKFHPNGIDTESSVDPSVYVEDFIEPLRDLSFVGLSADWMSSAWLVEGDSDICTVILFDEWDGTWRIITRNENELDENDNAINIDRLERGFSTPREALEAFRAL